MKAYSHVNCMRCGVLAALTVEDDSGHEIPDTTVSPEGGGMLAYVCPDCMTTAEVMAVARSSAAELLDMAEEMIASLDMIAKRVPTTREDPDFTQAYAEAVERRNVAQRTLDALLREPE